MRSPPWATGHVMSLEKEKRPTGKDERGDDCGWSCLSGRQASGSTCGIAECGAQQRALWEPDPRLWDGSRLSARPHGQDLAGSSYGRAGEVGREEVGPGTASGHSWAHSSTVNLAGRILTSWSNHTSWESTGCTQGVTTGTSESHRPRATFTWRECVTSKLSGFSSVLGNGRH